MKKTQWITAVVALVIVFGLFAATQKKIFGPPRLKKPGSGMTTEVKLSVDTILFHAKENLSAEQATRINALEHSITRGDVKEQQLHVYHQLARFWGDTARAFAPFAWYTAEAARLENSEKSLTFAAHLFLNNLIQEPDPQLKQWQAFQARDLFERSLKLNPANDSSKVALGAVYVYGGIAMPMEGIEMMRKVADKDSANVYAQWMLGHASLRSGQLEKAGERFKRVAALQPANWQATLLVAEVSEQTGKNEEAVTWYNRALPLLTEAAIKKEVEARIAKLRK